MCVFVLYVCIFAFGDKFNANGNGKGKGNAVNTKYSDWMGSEWESFSNK